MPALTIQEAFDLAVRHHQAGRLHDAEPIYRQILTSEPKHAGALVYLGVMAWQMGRHDVAVDLIRQAIAIAPNWADAHNNLGNVLLAEGQVDQAIAAYRQALALNPDSPGAAYNLGNALKANRQLDEAIMALRQAIALQPNYPDAYNSLGVALKDKGCVDAAIAEFRQALALNADHPEAHNNLGVALQAAGRFDQAIAAFRQAIALRPNYVNAHNNIGSVLQEMGQTDAAIATLQKALELRPDDPGAYSNLGNAWKDAGQLDNAIAAYRQAIALKPGDVAAHSNLILALHYHPDMDAAAIGQELGRWNQPHAEPLKPCLRPHDNDRNPDRRLRIGYVSADLREHAVGQFLLPLLANHVKQCVEVFGYAQLPVHDAMTERIRSHTDAWRSLVGLADAQAAALIRQDRIDVLVDLGLHTANSRLLVFAYKPAPVQATYLAYAGSSGLSTMDYRVSDPYLDPPGGDELDYSEQTVRLPETYWCYRPMVDDGFPPSSRQENDSITFGCLNNFCKINKPLLNLWAQVLNAVPHSRLLLHAHEGSHRQRVREYLQRQGVDSQRIRFMGRVSRPVYFAQYQSIDIALDTYPFGGGTTTCDALWMGVPMVSLAGTTAVSRAGTSILSNIGLPDLVAHTPMEYVQLAVELANDPLRLRQLRSTLRQRMEASPLMDAPRFARHMEAAYRQMWQKWCAA